MMSFYHLMHNQAKLSMHPQKCTYVKWKLNNKLVYKSSQSTHCTSHSEGVSDGVEYSTHQCSVISGVYENSVGQ